MIKNRGTRVIAAALSALLVLMGGISTGPQISALHNVGLIADEPDGGAVIADETDIEVVIDASFDAASNSRTLVNYGVGTLIPADDGNTLTPGAKTGKVKVGSYDVEFTEVSNQTAGYLDIYVINVPSMGVSMPREEAFDITLSNAYFAFPNAAGDQTAAANYWGNWTTSGTGVYPASGVFPDVDYVWTLDPFDPKVMHVIYDTSSGGGTLNPATTFRIPLSLITLSTGPVSAKIDAFGYNHVANETKTLSAIGRATVASTSGVADGYSDVVTLNNIVIREVTLGALETGVTYFYIDAPAGFCFVPGDPGAYVMTDGLGGATGEVFYTGAVSSSTFTRAIIEMNIPPHTLLSGAVISVNRLKIKSIDGTYETGKIYEVSLSNANGETDVAVVDNSGAPHAALPGALKSARITNQTLPVVRWLTSNVGEDINEGVLVQADADSGFSAGLAPGEHIGGKVKVGSYTVEFAEVSNQTAGYLEIRVINVPPAGLTMQREESFDVTLSNAYFAFPNAAGDQTGASNIWGNWTTFGVGIFAASGSFPEVNYRWDLDPFDPKVMHVRYDVPFANDLLNPATTFRIPLSLITIGTGTVSANIAAFGHNHVANEIKLLSHIGAAFNTRTLVNYGEGVLVQGDIDSGLHAGLAPGAEGKVKVRSYTVEFSEVSTATAGYLAIPVINVPPAGVTMSREESFDITLSNAYFAFPNTAGDQTEVGNYWGNWRTSYSGIFAASGTFPEVSYSWNLDPFDPKVMHVRYNVPTAGELLNPATTFRIPLSLITLSTGAVSVKIEAIGRTHVANAKKLLSPSGRATIASTASIVDSYDTVITLHDIVVREVFIGALRGGVSYFYIDAPAGFCFVPGAPGAYVLTALLGEATGKIFYTGTSTFFTRAIVEMDIPPHFELSGAALSVNGLKIKSIDGTYKTGKFYEASLSNADGETNVPVVNVDGSAHAALPGALRSTGITAQSLLVVLWTVDFVVSGDVNGDGNVNIQDVSKIFLHLRNKTANPLTDAQLAAADVNHDGVVNIQDVSKLFLHLRNKELNPLN